MKAKNTFKRVLITSLMVMVLCSMMFVPALAADDVNPNLIGASPSQLNPTWQGINNYGFDPSLPIILAFDDNASAVVEADIAFMDVTDANNPTTVTYAISRAATYLQTNEIVLVPQTALTPNNFYTITYDGVSFTFKVKKTGGGSGDGDGDGTGGGTGGGQAAPVACIGRIVDNYLMTQSGTTVIPSNQRLIFTFTHNVAVTSNANAIHVLLNGSEITDYSVQFTYAGSRWMVGIIPTNNTWAAGDYVVYIDNNNFAANNNNPLQGVVYETFTVN